MKKIIFILSTVLCFVSVKGQYVDYSSFLDTMPFPEIYYTSDTTNLLNPDVLNAPCENGRLGAFYFYTEMGELNIYTVAQPFKVNQPTPIKSIVILGSVPMDYSYFENIDTFSYKIQILDTTLNNIIYQTGYDTIINSHNCMTRFREIMFDSTIIVNNNFYVAFTYDTTLFLNTNDELASAYCIMFLKQDSCNILNYKYDFPKIKPSGTNDWIYADEIPIYSNTPLINSNPRTMAALLVFPRIDTAYVLSSSSNQSIGTDMGENISIFPNPTKNILNVESTVLIKEIELVNPLGQALFKNNAINSHNYQINLENYPTGTYLIKVLTNSGQATKKVINE